MPNDYAKERERARRIAAERSLAGRDIGRLPPIADPGRRASAGDDFGRFCTVYFAHTFALPWCADHLRVIDRIETSVMDGGLFAMSMPRGSGKTSLCEAAAIFAVLNGYRRFVMLFGADEHHAQTMLDSIKTELASNAALLADYPEAVYPVHCLEQITQRAKGQLYSGEPTRLGWGKSEIVLPTIAGSLAAGAIIRVSGITAGFRGTKYKRADGQSVRPDLVVIDDPQTDESARSPKQCADREQIVSGAILGLAGPGQKIAGIMPCTVIRSDDLADRLLNRELHPAWHGERTKLVYSFPSDQALWDRYREILEAELRDGGDGSRATEFYRQNRAAMDAGAQVAWPERKYPDELSALQHAMNLLFRDEVAFYAEYQNEPLEEQLAAEMLTPEEIAGKLNGYPRSIAPTDVTHLAGFIDVHDRLLYWTICGFGDGATGWVVDYGAWPEQKQAYFSLSSARNTLGKQAPGQTKEAALLAGLTACFDHLFARQWRREDGATLSLDQVLVDVGYLPEVVQAAIRTHPQGSRLLGSMGVGITAKNKPFSEYKKHPGDQFGHYWRVPAARGGREKRTVHVDTNYWKSDVHGRLGLPLTSPGNLSLFGKSPKLHRLLADHLTAEYAVPTEGRGRKLMEWSLKPGGPDNHWLDCLVGCCVAASMLGVYTQAQRAAKPKGPRKARVSYL